MVTLFLLIVLMVGIKVRFAYNYEYDYFSLNVIILNRIYVLKIRLEIFDGILYYSINGSVPKRVTLPEKKENVKTDVKFPRINIYDADINVRIGSSNTILTGIAGQIINTALLALSANGKIRIKNMEKAVITDYGSNVFKLNISFVIKFSVLKIIFYSLHILIEKKLRRKNNGIESDRRVDVVNS